MANNGCQAPAGDLDVDVLEDRATSIPADGGGLELEGDEVVGGGEADVGRVPLLQAHELVDPVESDSAGDDGGDEEGEDEEREGHDVDDAQSWEHNLHGQRMPERGVCPESRHGDGDRGRVPEDALHARDVPVPPESLHLLLPDVSDPAQQRSFPREHLDHLDAFPQLDQDRSVDGHDSDHDEQADQGCNPHHPVQQDHGNQDLQRRAPDEVVQTSGSRVRPETSCAGRRTTASATSCRCRRLTLPSFASRHRTLCRSTCAALPRMRTGSRRTAHTAPIPPAMSARGPCSWGRRSGRQP
eukprot:753168-Hanusia_phi.AAC.1